jgi:hypothetical protein
MKSQQLRAAFTIVNTMQWQVQHTITTITTITPAFCTHHKGLLKEHALQSRDRDDLS